ncbi:hypothetical protein OROMI_010483 [Orobanche minor]
MSLKPLFLKLIWLGGKIKIQEVEYENIPAYCSICKHLGHAFKDCKSSKNPGAVGETAIVRPLHKEVDFAVQHKSSPDARKTIRKKPQEGSIREPENEKLVVDKCPNANDRAIGTQNEIVGPSFEVESDIEVVSNSKKKKVKKKKKLY